MMTVRYPDGTAVQYNGAVRLKYSEGVWQLYADSDCTKWIASIQLSAGVIVEGTVPCKAYNPTRPRSVAEMVEAILAKRSLDWQDAQALTRLKNGLRGFNARRGAWREAR